MKDAKNKALKKAKGGKKAHLELASEYRSGKHSFKHPKNATKLAEMHERSASGKTYASN